jgi:hypothetical protein
VVGFITIKLNVYVAIVCVQNSDQALDDMLDLLALSMRKMDWLSDQ